MKVLSQIPTEITYVVELTEREIGTIKIALGEINNFKVKEEAKKSKSKVFETDKEHQDFYIHFVKLVGDAW